MRALNDPFGAPTPHIDGDRPAIVSPEWFAVQSHEEKECELAEYHLLNKSEIRCAGFARNRHHRIYVSPEHNFQTLVSDRWIKAYLLDAFGASTVQ